MDFRLVRATLLLGSASLVASLATAAPAAAQEAPAATPQDEAAAPADEGNITVTGTRVQRSGFSAPTPETTLGAEEIQTRAPANLANLVNDLPQLAPTVSPGTTLIGVGGGTGGANILNLRGLGINRTLVLLNSNRVAPSTVTGGVDVNTLPQGLVKRVDVVTGGASAAWGSDAVAGVVNFVLDTKFVGLKANIQAGESFRGDTRNITGGITWGTSFAEGRGHFLFDAGGSYQGGIDHYSDRSWYKGWKIVNNPAYAAGNGQPQQIVSTADFLYATPGGIILSGPNAFAKAFDANGAVIPFDKGTPTSIYKIGGTPNDISASYQLLVPVKYGNVFSRLSYDLTDNISAYAEGSYAASRTVNTSVPYPAAASIVIQGDNAYLPASLAGSAFVFGKVFTSLGDPIPQNDRETLRFVGGLEGKFGGGWNWKAYYQHGESRILNQVSNDPITGRVALAVDAVNSGGTIVCRSTIATPGNGCAPLNPFGTAPASAAAKAYVTGTSIQHTRLKENVAALSINGEPFSLWAGPISLAAGAEYRTESYVADADAQSIAGVFWVGNYKPGSGKYNVKEAYAEAVLPLLRDVPLFQKLDLDLAGRITDYSTSGTVKTYKAGISWDLTDGVRIRGTHSRDIRAPNLNDLFLGGQANTQIFTDPANGNASVTVTQVLQGNPALKPEIAKADTVGLVLSPRFLPGFSASVDWYRTDISGAITSLGGQQIINNCAAGQTGYCAAVIRNSANQITRVNVSGFNANSEKLSGIDYELAYSHDLGPGKFTLRVLATNTRKRTITALGGTSDLLGMTAAGNPPKWRWYNSVAYEVGPSRTQITMHRVGSGVIDTKNIECTSSCPTSTAAHPTINNNRINGQTTFDISQTFKAKVGGHDAEVFGVIENLFDKDPPIAAYATFLYPGTTANFYDTVGRRFRIGARVKY